ncbi:hypothetical protein EDB87DRAFT_1182108 [Lactarius vividus]|nr:hypothetical protein EDB87DRAFT_1182108 [Lactarius vividus]
MLPTRRPTLHARSRTTSTRCSSTISSLFPPSRADSGSASSPRAASSAEPSSSPALPGGETPGAVRRRERSAASQRKCSASLRARRWIRCASPCCCEGWSTMSDVNARTASRATRSCRAMSAPSADSPLLLLGDVGLREDRMCSVLANVQGTIARIAGTRSEVAMPPSTRSSAEIVSFAGH